MRETLDPIVSGLEQLELGTSLAILRAESILHFVRKVGPPLLHISV